MFPEWTNKHMSENSLDTKFAYFLFILFVMPLTPSPFVLQNAVVTLAITPDGRWLASGSLDKSVRIWDPRNAALQCILDDGQRVFSVDFSPAGGYLASGGDGGKVTIWSFSSTTVGGSQAHEGDRIMG
jgi:WD40 repeat protein